MSASEGPEGRSTEWDNRDAPALYRTSGATPENGEVVDQDAQADFAILTGIGSCSQGNNRNSEDSHERRFVKPHIAFFHEYWRFRGPIDEITSKGTPRCLFAARAVHCNLYAHTCPSGRFFCP